MGLLSALKLPRPQHWPAEAAPKQAVAKPRLAAVARQAETVSAGDSSPEDEEDERTRLGRRGDEATAAAESPTPSPSADDAEVPAPREAEVEGDAEAATDETAASDKPTTTEEVGYGDFSLGLKESADGSSLVVKWEHKQNVAAQNFKVWVIPCYVKADLKIGIEGEIVIKGKGDRQVNLKAGGALELGVGGTSEAVTAGPYGEVALTASTKVPTRLSEAREIAMNPFVVDIHGTGKVGIKFELKDSWTRNSDCELANWHLFVVHMGAYANGRFGPIRVEPGKDMQRLFAALQQVGPAIADAVDKYAPDKVKQLAEDGAKWVAESDDAKAIADGTGVVLDKIEEETGVDIGNGAEKVVQFLVDPEGETSSEANARFTREAEAANAAHADFRSAMQASGLDDELRSQNEADKADYNAIVDAKDAGGDWKSMIPALVAKRKTRRFEQAKAEAARRKKAQCDADAAAAADLARRVKAAEAELAQALKGANEVGIPLRAKTIDAPESAAFKGWQKCMNSFWSPGTKAALEVKGLQGEARIAKARQATGLLIQARSGFQQARSMIQ